MAHRTLILVLLGTLVLAGCTGMQESAVAPDRPDELTTQGVSGSAGSVGGSVENSPPFVVSFTQSATTGENRGGFVVVLTGRVRDNNTESQIENVSVTASGPVVLGANHVLTAADRNDAVEPAAFGADGFKVWNPTKNDGILEFRYQQSFPAFTPAGTYAFRASVADKSGASAVSAPLAVTLTAFSDITIHPTPVSASGAALPGQNWGQWTAAAGASNVASSNYIKLVNTGDVGASRVVIDLASGFVGATDANFSIPADNNVQFAWCEDTTPATSAPSECTFSFGPASPDATATVQFTGKNNVAYVTYRIVKLPDVLPVQSYGISFTVTEL